jgi:hypothetical protein
VNPTFEWKNGSIYGWDIIEGNNSRVDLTEDSNSFVLELQCNGSCHSGIVQLLETHYDLSQIEHISLRSYYKIVSNAEATSIGLNVMISILFFIFSLFLDDILEY